MNFPEKVTFKLIDEETRKPTENIATLLILYAHKKNNYSIGIEISDKGGLTYFTKQDCIDEIKKYKKAYIMDYFSNLIECLPKVSLQIISYDQIAYIVERRRDPDYAFKDYWRSDKIFLKHLESCNNAKYLSKLYTFTEEQLWKNKIITIELMPVKTNSQN